MQKRWTLFPFFATVLRMEPDVCGLEAGRSAAQTSAAPWAHEYVELSKQAHSELVMQANYWKALHGRAIGRSQ